MAGRTPFTNVDPETAADLRLLGFDPHELDRATEQLLTYIRAELLPAPPVSDAPPRSIFSRLLITEAAHEPSLRACADLISVLPEDLLLEILERLGSARAAAGTSLLSRRSRGLWTRLPNLTLSLHDLPFGSLKAALNNTAPPGMYQRLLLDRYSIYSFVPSAT